MPTVQVLIFRGLYNPDHLFHNEAALVRAGHVGVMGVIPDKIIGFHPSPEAAGGEEALLEALQQKQPQPGRLQDDNAYFERAVELIDATDGRTTVYTYEVEISEETLNQIRSWYSEGKETLYSFPDEDGQFKRGESNCVIFWQLFSLPLPVISGNIREIIQIMDEEGYDK